MYFDPPICDCQTVDMFTLMGKREISVWGSCPGQKSSAKLHEVWERSNLISFEI